MMQSVNTIIDHSTTKFTEDTLLVYRYYILFHKSYEVCIYSCCLKLKYHVKFCTITVKFNTWTSTSAHSKTDGTAWQDGVELEACSTFGASQPVTPSYRRLIPTTNETKYSTTILYTYYEARSTQPGHPSLSRCNEYQWTLGHKQAYPWSGSVSWSLAEALRATKIEISAAYASCTREW